MRATTPRRVRHHSKVECRNTLGIRLCLRVEEDPLTRKQGKALALPSQEVIRPLLAVQGKPPRSWQRSQVSQPKQSRRRFTNLATAANLAADSVGGVDLQYQRDRGGEGHDNGEN